MKNTKFFYLVALAAWLVLPIIGRAQPFSIDWFKIAGGGGTSSNGLYTLSGTIGQPDAGAAMTGGGFSLTGGFWSLIAVQTLGAPLLTISLTKTNTVLISWPAPSTGFSLQQNADLNTVNWTPGPLSTVVGGQNQVIIAPPTGNEFYRLKSP